MYGGLTDQGRGCLHRRRSKRPLRRSATGKQWCGILGSFDELEGPQVSPSSPTTREPTDPDAVGGVLTRRVTARSSSRAHGRGHLAGEPPWLPQRPLHELHLHYDCVAPKSPGCGSRICDGSCRSRNVRCDDKDLRSQFGPPRDQDPRPTCMAFAASDAHAGARSSVAATINVEWAYYRAQTRRRCAPRGRDHEWNANALRLEDSPRKRLALYCRLFTDIAAWIPPKADPVYRRNSSRVPRPSRRFRCLDADHPVLFTMSVPKSFFSPGPVA